MKFVMVDIETLGTGFDSVVASIGAIGFDLKTGVFGAEFERLICIDSSVAAGLKMDCDTVAWWAKQSEDAQKQLDGSAHARRSIVELWHWFHCLGEKRKVVVFGNGPTFDLAILRYHFEYFGFELPWHFWNERCVRTEVDMGRAVGIDPKKTLPFVGVPHSALDDAKHQAQYVSVIHQHVIGLDNQIKAVNTYLENLEQKSA